MKGVAVHREEVFERNNSEQGETLDSTPPPKIPPKQAGNITRHLRSVCNPPQQTQISLRELNSFVVALIQQYLM